MNRVLRNLRRNLAARLGVIAAVAATVLLCAAGAVSGSRGVARRAGNATDIPHALAVSPDGARVFVSGDSDGGMKTNYDFATVAYNVQTGREIWVTRYNGPASRPDGAEAIGLSGNGKRVYVTGATVAKKKSGFDYGTLAYDAATGKRLWVARYNGPAGRGDGGEDLAVSPDEARVFVTGTSDGGKATDDDFATIGYDARTGRRLWVARYDGPGHGIEEWPSIAASADGTKVFVSGGSLSDTGSDYAVIAYDASSGAQLWVSRYDGPAHGGGEACSVAVAGDGSKVFASGYTDAGSNWDDATTIAFDAATGARLWVASYAGVGTPADGTNVDDRTCNLHVSRDGTKVFGTGFCCSGENSGGDYLTVAYDAATGKRLWAARYDDPVHGDDWAHSLDLSPDGTKVFINGESEARKPRYGEDATVAYDAETGTQLWSARYGGPGKTLDSGESLGVSAKGTRVLVTGASIGKTKGSDYATIAYAAAGGHRVWVRRYNGPGVICLVPYVGGKTLRAARADIRAADCTVGKITRDPSASGKKGRVFDQYPRAGTRLAPKGLVKLWIKP
jgi:WD40 repeat protein